MIWRVVGPLFGISVLLNLLLFSLWLGNRDARNEEIGACNADKLQTELDAAVAKLATRDEVHARELAAERRQNAELLEALNVERENAELARSRPAQVRTIVKEIEGECMDQTAPDAALDSVYDSVYDAASHNAD